MLQLQAYLNQQIELTLQTLNYPKVNYLFDRPKVETHGDISLNIAMLLSKELKGNPRQIAEEIVKELNVDSAIIEKIEIAGPGFINFFLAKEGLQKSVERILQSPENYGKFDIGKSRPAMVEFVSANPTGPLTIGHGRQAVLGDTIATLMEWLGYKITREYYFNNAGRQMRVLAESVQCRYRQLLGDKLDFPEDYYQGNYITAIAEKIIKEHGNSLKESSDLAVFQKAAEEEIFADIKNTLANLGVHFDSFFNESDLYKSGAIDSLIVELKDKNLAYDKDGATWFKATELGLEQDRVIVKSSGEPTYRLPDIAYHIDKYKRNFELMIDIFGADHIAAYPDVLAGLKAMGFDTEKVKVLIHQFVTLYEGNEKVKMSTRKANFVTLDELVEEVGADVTRWYFLTRSMQSHLNFDLSKAKNISNTNPAFYSHYAHARICSIFRNAREKGIAYQGKYYFHHLEHQSEIGLIKKLIEFPKIVFQCANEYEPHILIKYMSEVSKSFHRFYTDCHVLSLDQPELTQARLGVCLAVKTVLGNGFKILGVSAPEKM